MPKATDGRPPDTAPKSGLAALIACKPIGQLQADSPELPDGEGRAPGGGQTLARTLTVWDLTALGVGAIIGAGIFSVTGTAVSGGATRIGAGPALIISYLLTAVACGFAALCYAEFAALIPVAGSAYTYAYVTLGELTAWTVGWNLILEYAVGNIAVAVSWSGYLQQFLAGLGVHLPLWLATDLHTGLGRADVLATAPRLLGLPIILNLPAFGVVMLLTGLLIRGVKESARFNQVIVALKLVVVLGFIVAGWKYVAPQNWHPFAPNGVTGILSGAAVVFFSYIGFDAVSTAAEETKNPQRDMPIGMISSLVVCTILYVAVTAVLTGLVPWQKLGSESALADALVRHGVSGVAGVLSFGAVIAMTAVLLVFQMGQPRILYSMARDGLLPGWFAHIHPRYRTPDNGTMLTGLFVGIPSMLVDINDAADLCSVGTLFAFVLVSAGVLVLRRSAPHLHRPFRCPLVPWVPLCSMAACTLLIFYLPGMARARFVIWLAVGLAVYFLYGIKHSRLRHAKSPG